MNADMTFFYTTFILTTVLLAFVVGDIVKYKLYVPRMLTIHEFVWMVLLATSARVILFTSVVYIIGVT